MSPAFTVLMVIFAFTSMFAIGLETDHGAILRVLRSHGLIVRSVLAGTVLVPLLAYLVTARLPLSPEVHAGIMLVAMAPGGALALQFTRSTHSPEFAGAIQFLFSLIGILVAPFLVSHLMALETPLHVHPLELFAIAILQLFVPLALGRLVHAKTQLAPAVAKISNIIAGVSFVVAFLVLAAPQKSEARELVGKSGLLAMLIVITLSMLIGWILGGPSLRTRQIVMTKVSLRNVALALIMAHQGFSNRMVAMAVMAYAALMVPLNFLVNTALNVMQKRKEKHAHHHAGT